MVVHISHDAWVEDDKLDLPMARMSEADLQRFGLPADGGCDWWSTPVEVLPYGVVLDFVFSDSALRAWDNNGQQARRCPPLRPPTCACTLGLHMLINLPRSLAPECSRSTPFGAAGRPCRHGACAGLPQRH